VEPVTGNQQDVVAAWSTHASMIRAVDIYLTLPFAVTARGGAGGGAVRVH
jgi:hypothetical protein